MAFLDLFRREKQPEPRAWLTLPHQTLPNCSPQELMEKKGKYYKLIEIQSMGDLLRKKKEEENFE